MKASTEVRYTTTLLLREQVESYYDDEVPSELAPEALNYIVMLTPRIELK